MAFIMTGIVLALIVAFIVIYNALVRDINLVREAWSGIDVQLKRRHDLIPKLIAAVESYTAYEKSTLDHLVKLRSQSASTSSPSQKAGIEKEISSDIGRFFALAESYPDLKANQNFIELQKSASEVEDQIQLSRRYYNGAVRNFNVRIASIPSVFVARSLGYKPFEYFAATDREKSDVSMIQ